MKSVHTDAGTLLAQLSEPEQSRALVAGHLTALARIEEAGEVFDDQDYAMMIRACRRVGLWEQASDLVYGIGDPKRQHFADAIRACSRAGATQAAVELLGAMAEQGPGFEPREADFAELIVACACAQPPMPELGGNMLSAIANNGDTPSSRARFAMAVAHAVSGNWSHATHQLKLGVDQMPACDQGGKQDAGRSTFKGRGKGKGKGQNKHAHGGADGAGSRGAGDAGDGTWRLPVEALDRMRSKGVVPDVVSFGPAIAACHAEGQWAECVKLWHAVLQGDVALDDASVDLLLEACERAGAVEEATQLLLHVQREVGMRLEWSQQEAAPAHGARADFGDVDQDLGHYLDQEQEELGARLAAAYLSALRACETRGDAAEAAALLARMDSAGIDNGSSITGRAVAARACARAGSWADASAHVRQALSLISENQAGVTTLDLNESMIACQRVGEWGALLGLLDTFAEMGASPGEDAIASALHACEHVIAEQQDAEQARRAPELLLLMLLNDAEIGAKTSRQLLRLFKRAGELQRGEASDD